MIVCSCSYTCTLLSLLTASPRCLSLHSHTHASVHDHTRCHNCSLQPSAHAGLREHQLPRPGEVASYDELLTMMAGLNASALGVAPQQARPPDAPPVPSTARLVSDPVPFLATTRPPLDRCVAVRVAHAAMCIICSLFQQTRHPDHQLT